MNPVEGKNTHTHHTIFNWFMSWISVHKCQLWFFTRWFIYTHLTLFQIATKNHLTFYVKNCIRYYASKSINLHVCSTVVSNFCHTLNHMVVHIIRSLCSRSWLYQPEEGEYIDLWLLYRSAQNLSFRPLGEKRCRFWYNFHI